MTGGKALSVRKGSVCVIFVVLAVFFLKPSPAGLADRSSPVSLHDFRGLEPGTLKSQMCELYGAAAPKRVAWQAVVALPSEWGSGYMYGIPDGLSEVLASETGAGEADKSKARAAIVGTVAEILGSLTAAVADTVKHAAEPATPS